MTIRERFKKKVIELNHPDRETYGEPALTIGCIINAIHNYEKTKKDLSICRPQTAYLVVDLWGPLYKKRFETTLEDQSEETIEKLFKLL